MTVPEALKRFRKEFKVTQKQVAQIIGVTERAYQDYETDKTKIPAVAVAKVADFYKVSADYLLGRTSVSNSASVALEVDKTKSEVESIKKDLHAEVDKLAEQRLARLLPALRALQAAGFTYSPDDK